MKNYRDKFEEIKLLDPVPRGNAFERLIQEIFEDSGILLRGRTRTHGNTQELDGAIKVEHKIFLLEVKWEQSKTLAASKLYSFLGKINSKIEGTLGIFISYNTLKENFVNAIRDGLRQNCILIHGEENIFDIVDGKVDMDKFVMYCWEQASINNRKDISTSEFLSIPQKVVAGGTSPNSWTTIYNLLTNNSSVKNFIGEIEAIYNNSEEIGIKTVNILPSLSYSALEKEKLKILLKKIQEEEMEEASNRLIHKFKGDTWREYASEYIFPFIEGFKFEASRDDRLKIIQNLKDAFNGDWEHENQATRILRLFIRQYDKDELKILANLYVNIYCDINRLDKFDQKKFSNELFQIIINKGYDLYEMVEEKVSSDLDDFWKIEKAWIEKGKASEEELKLTTTDFTLNKYSKLFALQEGTKKKVFEKIIMLR